MMFYCKLCDFNILSGNIYSNFVSSCEIRIEQKTICLLYAPDQTKTLDIYIAFWTIC